MKSRRLIRIAAKKSNPFYGDSTRNQTTEQACLIEKSLESKDKVFHNPEGRNVYDTNLFCCLFENCSEHTINTLQYQHFRIYQIKMLNDFSYKGGGPVNNGWIIGKTGRMRKELTIVGANFILSKSALTPAKAGVQKRAKIMDSAVLHFVSGFRRNDNNALLKLARCSYNFMRNNQSSCKMEDSANPCSPHRHFLPGKGLFQAFG
jgi:hypothetical protein